MSFIHMIILGLVEGLTEFIPISSSAHLVLARSLFNIHGHDLAIDAVIQAGTILAVLAYFGPDLWHLFKAFVRMCMGKIVANDDRRTVWGIITGTIPGVILGLLLQSKMETVFRNLHWVAIALILGSVLMYVADRVAKQNRQMSVLRGSVIGFFQALALVPGVSRSGATISGGLLLGLRREDAARYSFLLSFPIILGAGLKSVSDIHKSGELLAVFNAPLLAGMVTAFVVGLLSIHILLNYLKHHKLTVFVWYRIALAVAILLFI